MKPPDDIAVHWVCDKHWPAEAIPYRIVIDASINSPCDHCSSLATAVYYTRVKAAA